MGTIIPEEAACGLWEGYATEAVRLKGLNENFTSLPKRPMTTVLSEAPLASGTGEKGRSRLSEEGRAGRGKEFCSTGNEAPGSSHCGFHGPPEERGP